MTNLSYSNDAENVLNRFYGVDLIVYVEGSDDIPFWEFLFELFVDYSVEINDVGGLPEIEKYISKVEAGEINAVVACDADFSYSGNFSEHSNVLRSYGYSIENSLICDNTIKKVIRSIGRIPRKKLEGIKVSDWLNRVESCTKKLVIHDIANHKLNTGQSVAGNNCSKFMKSKKSSEICVNKIETHLARINLNIPNDLKLKIENSIVESDRTEIDFLRGHFLFSASLKFIISKIKEFGKKVSISNDSLFSALIIAFEAVFNSSHKQYNYYKNIICKVKL